MNTLLVALRKTELFQNLPDEILLGQILPYRQIADYQKGQFLIEPQQKVDRLGIVLSGRVNILHISPEGGYSLMSVRSRGELLGMDLVCTRSQVSPYHAIAALPTQVLYLPVSLLLASHQLPEALRMELLNRMLLLISNENMRKEYRLTILSQKGLRQRIWTYLTMQAARRQKSSFSISFSREELAAYLCVNRSALSHELSLMERDGLIRFHKNTFTLLNAYPD